MDRDSESTGWAWIPSSKISLIGQLVTIAMGKEATGRVVFTCLCAPFRWRLHCSPVSAASWWSVVGTSPLWTLWVDEWVGSVWTDKHIFKGFCAFLRIVADAERDGDTQGHTLEESPHPHSGCLLVSWSAGGKTDVKMCHNTTTTMREIRRGGSAWRYCTLGTVTAIKQVNWW